MKRRFAIVSVLVLLVAGLLPSAAGATSDCVFDEDGSTWTLTGDCTTDQTIHIPDGYTLDGNGYTITGVDPTGSHFTGAVVANAGTTAHVEDLGVTVAGLANVCDAGADRLRGILFEGASGSITGISVHGINQGPSGCQEGNAIEVRNAPFDGTHPATQTVDVSFNEVDDYQKSGIVANGDVAVTITHNDIGASATQDNLAANALQLGFGATGYVGLNQIDGNQWKGTSNYAATAILVYGADGVTVDRNVVMGNSDIGIYFFGNDGAVLGNKVFDEGADHPNSSYDIGIGNWGSDNVVEKNKVKNFEIPFSGDVDESDNKALPDHPES